MLDANWAADADGQSHVGWVYGHQGGRHDLAAGLVHFRNRDLDTSLGRWTRQDPAGYLDGMSIYQYIESNPIHRLDPSGLTSVALVVQILSGLPVMSWQGDPMMPQAPKKTCVFPAAYNACMTDVNACYTSCKNFSDILLAACQKTVSDELADAFAQCAKLPWYLQGACRYIARVGEFTANQACEGQFHGSMARCTVSWVGGSSDCADANGIKVDVDKPCPPGTRPWPPF